MKIGRIIGSRLKEVREEWGLTREKVAQDLNYKEGTILNWENGDTLPSVKRVAEMSEYFECSTDYLLGLKNEDDYDKADYCYHNELETVEDDEEEYEEYEEPTLGQKIGKFAIIVGIVFAALFIGTLI